MNRTFLLYARFGPIIIFADINFIYAQMISKGNVYGENTAAEDLKENGNMFKNPGYFARFNYRGNIYWSMEGGELGKRILLLLRIGVVKSCIGQNETNYFKERGRL